MQGKEIEGTAKVKVMAGCVPQLVHSSVDARRDILGVSFPKLEEQLKAKRSDHAVGNTISDETKAKKDCLTMTLCEAGVRFVCRTSALFNRAGSVVLFVHCSSGLSA